MHNMGRTAAESGKCQKISQFLDSNHTAIKILWATGRRHVHQRQTAEIFLVFKVVSLDGGLNTLMLSSFYYRNSRKMVPFGPIMSGVGCACGCAITCTPPDITLGTPTIRPAGS